MEHLENLEKAATHDLGGQSRFLCSPVDRTPDPELESEFSRTVDALRLILGSMRMMTGDQFRRHIEELSPEDYHRLGYYEKWLHSISLILLDKGVLKPGDLA